MEIVSSNSVSFMNTQWFLPTNTTVWYVVLLEISKYGEFLDIKLHVYA